MIQLIFYEQRDKSSPLNFTEYAVLPRSIEIVLWPQIILWRHFSLLYTVDRCQIRGMAEHYLDGTQVAVLWLAEFVVRFAWLSTRQDAGNASSITVIALPILHNEIPALPPPPSPCNWMTACSYCAHPRALNRYELHIADFIAFSCSMDRIQSIEAVIVILWTAKLCTSSICALETSTHALCRAYVSSSFVTDSVGLNWFINHFTCSSIEKYKGRSKICRRIVDLSLSAIRLPRR